MKIFTDLSVKITKINSLFRSGSFKMFQPIGKITQSLYVASVLLKMSSSFSLSLVTEIACKVVHVRLSRLRIENKFFHHILFNSAIH